MYKVKQIDFAVRYSFLVYQIVHLIFAADGMYTNNIFRKKQNRERRAVLHKYVSHSFPSQARGGFLGIRILR